MFKNFKGELVKNADSHNSTLRDYDSGTEVGPRSMCGNKSVRHFCSCPVGHGLSSTDPSRLLPKGPETQKAILVPIVKSFGYPA